MRRIFALLLALGMLGGLLCGCSANLDQNTESQEVADMLNGTDGDYALSTGATMPSETLIEDGKLLVRMTGLSGTLYYPRLNLAIDKGNNRTMDLSVDYAIVNGWQVSGSVHAYDDAFALFTNYAARMRRFSAYMLADTTTLQECGLMEDVWSVSFAYSLKVDPGDNSGDKIYEDVYSATTSAAGEPEEYVCDGPVLLDEADVKVQLFSLDNSGSSGGEDTGALILYLENHGDRRIVFEVADVTLNGESIFLVSSAANVIADGRRLFSAEFGSLTEQIPVINGDKLTFTLNVCDYDDYQSYDADDEGAAAPTPLASVPISLTVGEN